MLTTLKSISGIAVKGVKAHPQPGEVFEKATLNGDRLAIVYKRGAFSRHSCKGVTQLRIVTCERSFHDGDYVWLPIEGGETLVRL